MFSDLALRYQPATSGSDAHGRPIGLAGLVERLDRRARTARPAGRAVNHGFALDLRDTVSMQWWPQGITTTADHDPSEVFEGRRLLLSSSYAKTLRGRTIGSRISVFDLGAPQMPVSKPRYGHVVLIDADTGEPLRVHAGGIAWYGQHLHVAATARGLYTFHLDDIVALPSRTRGHRWGWPHRLRYAAQTADTTARLRHSFISLDRRTHHLIAGEYGRYGASSRLFRYDLDPDSGLLTTDADGLARPEPLDLVGIERMQGAVIADGRLCVSQSKGSRVGGSLWSGPVGLLSEYVEALPPGPEDLSYWPSQNRLWSVSEWPGRRYVYAVDLSLLRASEGRR